MIIEDLINDPNFNPNEYVGFVYMTTFLNLNKKYLGKKSFFHSVKRKIGKKEIALITGKGRKPITEKVQKDSGWKDYYGSEPEVIRLSKIEPKDKIVREVLRLCKDKRELTYFEVKYQFQYNVLESEQYFNSNILGKFFRKDLAS